MATQTDKDVNSKYIPQGLWNFYLSGQYTDLTINCHWEEFKVHKLIFCAQSPVFTAMYNEQFKEGIESVVNLPDDDVDITEQLIECLYTGNYKVGGKSILDNQLGPVSDYCPDLHAKVYAAADKYQISDLGKAAVRAYNMVPNLNPRNGSDDDNISRRLPIAYKKFLRSVFFVYQSTPSNKRELRDLARLRMMMIYHAMIINPINKVEEGFEEIKELEQQVLADNPEFAWDVLHGYRENKLACPACW